MKGIKNKKRKKGFTMMEVMVSMVIIAILVSIAYPLYMKSVNKSRVVEATTLLTAVRTAEQGRLAKGKEYFKSFGELSEKEMMSLIKAKKDDIKLLGNNLKIKDYELSLVNTEENSEKELCMGATYKDKFTIYMPVETSGIWCADAGSGSMCKSMSGLAQEVGEGENPCGEAIELAKTGCDASEKPASSESCSSCGGKRTRGVYCNKATGYWETGSWGSCSKPESSCPKDCKESERPLETTTCNGCGTQTREVTCNTSTGEWELGKWGECDKTEEECCTGSMPATIRTCNGCGKQTREVTCDSSGMWVGGPWGECSKTEEDCYTIKSADAICDDENSGVTKLCPEGLDSTNCRDTINNFPSYITVSDHFCDDIGTSTSQGFEGGEPSRGMSLDCYVENLLRFGGCKTYSCKGNSISMGSMEPCQTTDYSSYCESHPGGSCLISKGECSFGKYSLYSRYSCPNTECEYIYPSEIEWTKTVSPGKATVEYLQCE